jgi:hypothetical protein
MRSCLPSSLCSSYYFRRRDHSRLRAYPIEISQIRVPLTARLEELTGVRRNDWGLGGRGSEGRLD